MKRAVHFALHEAKGRGEVGRGSRLFNLFPRKSAQDAGSPYVLHGTHGTSLFATVGANPILGAHKFGDLVYAVTRDKLVSVNSAGTVTEIGPVVISGQASIDDNGSTMVIVDGQRGYQFDGTTLAEIDDPAFFSAHTVCHLDGYLIFERAGTSQFFIAGPDSIAFDATDIAEAETDSDDIIAVFKDHKELWLFGQRSTEIFYNSGNADFPFEPVQGASIEHGIAGPHAVTRADNAVYVLSNEGIFYSYRSAQAQRISTHEIETRIKGQNQSGTVAFAFYDEGHTFIQFNVGAITLVFDQATGLWHERGHIDHGRHQASCYVNAFGKHLIGDYSTGKIYELSLDTYDDAGRPLVSRATGAPIQTNRDRAAHHSFEIEPEVGVGLVTGQGSDPQAMLRFSDDKGRTWSNERWKSLGKRGRHGERVEWRRLGQSRNRIYEVAISDPVARAIMSTAYVEVS